MKHKHHIIPRHMGGTNEPSNLIELTIEEHAEAHRILYAKYGKIEDKIAWECLSGRNLLEEERILLSKKGFEKFMSDPLKKSVWREKIIMSRKKQTITPKHRKNISKGLKLAHAEGRRTYNFTEETRNLMRINYYKYGKNAMIEGRKKSQKWKMSVSSEECKQKKRLADPRSKRVSVDGIVYDSVRHASKCSNYSYSKLRSILHSNTNNNIFFC